MSAVQSAEWAHHGAFRAAFIERFEPADRETLRKAGVLLAYQAISGDVHQEPVVLSEFRAAIDDARWFRDYLLEIADKAVGSILPTEAADQLAKEARYWHGKASDLVNGMAASFEDATGEWPEEEDQP